MSRERVPNVRGTRGTRYKSPWTNKQKHENGEKIVVSFWRWSSSDGGRLHLHRPSPGPHVLLLWLHRQCLTGAFPPFPYYFFGFLLRFLCVVSLLLRCDFLESLWCCLWRSGMGFAGKGFRWGVLGWRGLWIWSWCGVGGIGCSFLRCCLCCRFRDGCIG